MEDETDIPIDDLDKMVGPYDCRVSDCKDLTSRPSGYCKKHEEEFAAILQDPILTCAKCQLKDNCPMHDIERKWCYYEFNLVSDDFNNREKVELEWMKMMHTIRKTAMRLRREAQSLLIEKEDPILTMEIDSNDKEIIALRAKVALLRSNRLKIHVELCAEARRQEELLGRQLVNYIKFMGWADSKLNKDEKLARAHEAIAALGSKEFQIAKIKVSENARNMDPIPEKPIVMDGDDIMPPDVLYDDTSEIEKAGFEIIQNPNDANYEIDFLDISAQNDTTQDEDLQNLEEMMEESNVSDPELMVTESGEVLNEDRDSRYSLRGRNRTISRKRKGVS